MALRQTDPNHGLRHRVPAPQMLFFGGAKRDRTADLLVANEALSQLSYSPTRREQPAFSLAVNRANAEVPDSHRAQGFARTALKPAEERVQMGVWEFDPAPFRAIPRPANHRRPAPHGAGIRSRSSDQRLPPRPPGPVPPGWWPAARTVCGADAISRDASNLR